MKPDKAYRKVINSWAMYDWANSAFATTIMAAVLPVYYSNVAASNLPKNIATAYWGYTTTIAMLLIAFLAPILGAIADFSGIKKKFLLSFVALGVFGTGLLYFVQSGDFGQRIDHVPVSLQSLSWMNFNLTVRAALPMLIEKLHYLSCQRQPDLLK